MTKNKKNMLQKSFKNTLIPAKHFSKSLAEMSGKQVGLIE